jgi:hypothetical protein
MHLLLPICGKFTRALLAHQIFSNANKINNLKMEAKGDKTNV